MPVRIACLIVPLFSLAARLRSEPDLIAEAVAVVEGNGHAAHIVAATRRARKKGVRPGQSLAQARAIYPKLIARGRDAECERAAQEALLDIAATFSPRVEDAGYGVAYLDVTGMERHWGSGGALPPAPAGAPPRRPPASAAEAAAAPLDAAAARVGVDSWQHLLGRAAIAAVERIGMPVRAGIAASKLAARVAAELPSSPTVVPEGEEAAFLAPLPLTRLAPQMEAWTMLERWGIDSIGALARLPESEIASRLGELGRELHWAARGVDPRPLTPRQLPPEFREGMDLEWPLVALEPFLFVAHAALDRLMTRLEVQGFACRRVELTLTLEPDGYHVRSIDLPAPTRDTKTILTLLRLDLEEAPPGAPVRGFAIAAFPDRPRRAQLSLFGPAALSPEKLATTIARLAAMIGEERIGMAVAVDGHLPERFAITGYAPPPPPDMRCAPQKSRGLLAVRVLRPPVPLEVITREGRDDEPAGLQIVSIREERPVSDDEKGSSRKALISGDARVSSGPWRLEEGWWTETPATREYWDVEIAGGGIYRLYRERSDGGWFADGVYD
jgi:protein ImuB